MATGYLPIVAAILVCASAILFEGHLSRLIAIISKLRRLKRPVSPKARLPILFGFVVFSLIFALTLPFMLFLIRAVPMPLEHFLLIALVGILLFHLSIFDIRYYWLPNTLTLGLALAGLLYAVEVGFLSEAVIGAASGFGVFYLLQQFYSKIRGFEAIGSGDVKLSAAMGAWLGIGFWSPAILAASVFALLVVGITRLVGVSVPGSKIPYGAYLSLAFWSFLLIRLVPYYSP